MRPKLIPLMLRPMLERTLLTLALVHVVSLPSLKADPLDKWTMRTPAPTDQVLRAIIFGGHRFVAVGGGPALSQPLSQVSSSTGPATIVTSTDGLGWANRDPHVAHGLTAVTWGNGLFVAVGYQGTILTSTDGLDWSAQNSGTALDLEGIAYGNGRFVAVGGGTESSQGEGTILTSPDGVTWKEHKSTYLTPLESVAFGAGKFLAITGASFLQSTDGLYWTAPQSTVLTNSPFTTGAEFDGASSISYADQRFVFTAGSRTASSSDGNIWTLSGDLTTLPSPDPGRPCCSLINGVTVGHQFVAVGPDGWILTSPDVLNWSAQLSGTYRHLYGAAFGNNQYVAVGNGGTILSSTDATNWVGRSGSAASSISDMTYGDAGFVAVATGGEFWSSYSSLLVVSVDGVGWRDIDLRSADRFPTGLASVLFGNGRYVALGTYACPQGECIVSWVSTNAVEWSRHELGIDAYFHSAAFGSSLFVAVGDGQGVFTSSDGITWTNRTLPVVPNVLTFGNGRFVGVGCCQTSLVSGDALNWRAVALSHPLTNGLTSIAYGNGRFVAVGQDVDVILTTADGVDWKAIDTQIGGLQNPIVRFGGGVFLISTTDHLFSSLDGLNWRVQAPEIPGVQALAYGHGTFVGLAGSERTGNQILQSGEIVPRVRALLPAGPDRFALEILGGLGGQNYSIDQSMDLTYWQAVQTNTITGDLLRIEVVRNLNMSGRFYRARQVP